MTPPDRMELAGEPEVLAPEAPADLALQLRDPRHGGTLDEVIVQKNWQDIFEARTTILQTARKRAIRITYPSDWNIYRDTVGTVIGYLSDAGCERVRDILGIEIFKVSSPEKLPNADGSFMYVQTADGRSKFTTQHVERMEGGRSSSEDFCRGVTGAQLELLVRKACRANLDGNIARELMGMKSVPLDEMIDAWQGTGKDWNQCRKARGFGSQSERMGATREGEPEVAPPTCPVCKGPDDKPLPLKYRAAQGTRAAFYGCVNYTKHPNQKVIIDAAAWAADENKRLDAEVAAREGSR